MSSSLVYNYNSPLHKFKVLHDETGGKLQEFDFKFYPCFCGCEEYKIISTSTRHKNPFNIVQCQQCGTLRINPYLSDSSIELYYREVYGPVKRQNATPEGLFERQAKSADELFDILRPFVPAEAKVLDYGSGAGGRMQRFQAEGYDVYLQDYDAKYLDYGVSKGMKPFAESLKYDAIILSHVLEHINQPQPFLEKLKGMLAQGGKIYIEVPMIENNRSLLADFQLAHKFYFTSGSLSYLASLVGLKVAGTAHNAVIVTPSQEIPKLSLTDIKQQSDKLIYAALAESRMTSARMFFKNLIKK